MELRILGKFEAVTCQLEDDRPSINTLRGEKSRHRVLYDDSEDGDFSVYMGGYSSADLLSFS